MKTCVVQVSDEDLGGPSVTCASDHGLHLILALHPTMVHAERGTTLTRGKCSKGFSPDCEEPFDLDQLCMAGHHKYLQQEPDSLIILQMHFKTKLEGLSLAESQILS